jgi:hypothetical protein
VPRDKIKDLLNPPPESVLQYFLDLIAEKKVKRIERGYDLQEWNEKARRGRQKAAAERSWKRYAEQYRARHWPKPGKRSADRLILSMEPGKWYSRGDLIRIAGLTMGDRIKIDQTLLRYALVQRARNPAWQGTEDGQMTKASDALEPLWLYRMTSQGEAYCDLLRMVCD